MSNGRDVLYRAGREVHRADDCRPLVEAVREGTMELRALARGHYPGERLRAAEVPGVSSLGYWRAAGRQRHGLAAHRNEGIELTMALQGESPAMVDGASYVLRPGEIMITRPWQLHAVGGPCFAPGKVGWLIVDVGVRHPHQAWRWPEWVNLSAADLARLTQSLRQNEDAVRAASPALREAFARLAALPEAGEAPFRGSRIAVGVCEVLVRLLELFHSHPVRLRPALTESSRTVRLYVEALAGQPVPASVEAMADACGLGVTRFGALFKEATGDTPGDYLLRRRLDEACRLLAEAPALSVEAVARRVGFSHGNYFARVFRRAQGVSPAAWRAGRA